VAARYAGVGLRRSLAWSILKVITAVPFAALGFAAHLVPFQIMKYLAKKPKNEGIKATVKLLGCVFLFAVTYAIIGFLIGQAFGAWVGVASSLAAPLCGYVTVRLAERVKRIGGLLAGYRTVRDRGAVIATVTGHRADVVRAAQKLLAET